MTDIDVAALIRDAMMLMLKMGGPPLLAGLFVGLVISLVQAVTQINEATLAFVPKVLAIGATLVLLGPYMTGALNAYTHRLFDAMVAVGGS
jgi:flagellar biosynthetic protein FliQ